MHLRSHIFVRTKLDSKAWQLQIVERNSGSGLLPAADAVHKLSAKLSQSEGPAFSLLPLWSRSRCPVKPGVHHSFRVPLKPLFEIVRTATCATFKQPSAPTLMCQVAQRLANATPTSENVKGCFSVQAEQRSMCIPESNAASAVRSGAPAPPQPLKLVLVSDRGLSAVTLGRQFHDIGQQNALTAPCQVAAALEPEPGCAVKAPSAATAPLPPLVAKASTQCCFEPSVRSCKVFP
jgi:hypothetical protein